MFGDRSALKRLVSLYPNVAASSWSVLNSTNFVCVVVPSSISISRLCARLSEQLINVAVPNLREARLLLAAAALRTATSRTLAKACSQLANAGRDASK
jgi:hypothetical protein